MHKTPFSQNLFFLQSNCHLRNVYPNYVKIGTHIVSCARTSKIYIRKPRNYRIIQYLTMEYSVDGMNKCLSPATSEVKKIHITGNCSENDFDF